MFNSTITMVKHAYAFFFNDAWFRGIVMDVNFNIIKVSKCLNLIVYKIN